MAENEEVTDATKTLSPQELQLKALANKAEDFKQQKKSTQGATPKGKGTTQLDES